MRIKLLYLIKFLGTFYVYNPILSYYLKENLTLSYGQISSLMGIFYLTMLIVDIPSGIIADKSGKKRALVLGYLLCSPSMLLLYIAKDYYTCLIAYMVLACGITTICNSDIALLYEVTTQPGCANEDASKNRGRYLTATLIAGVLSSLGCSLFVRNNYRSAFLMNMIIFMICAILTLLVPSSTNYLRKDRCKHRNIAMDDVLSDARRRDVILLGIYYAVYNAAYQGIYSNIQIFFSGVGISSVYSGYIYIALSLLPIISIKLLHGRLNRVTGFISNILFVVILFLLMVLHNMMLILLLMFVWRFMYGFFAPNTSSIVDNRIGDSEYRSTILAAINVIESLLTFIILWVEGYIADRFGGRYMLAVSFIIVMLLTIMLPMNGKNDIYLGTQLDD